MTHNSHSSTAQQLSRSTLLVTLSNQMSTICSRSTLLATLSNQMSTIDALQIDDPYDYTIHTFTQQHPRSTLLATLSNQMSTIFSRSTLATLSNQMSTIDALQIDDPYDHDHRCGIQCPLFQIKCQRSFHVRRWPLLHFQIKCQRSMHC